MKSAKGKPKAAGVPRQGLGRPEKKSGILASRTTGILVMTCNVSIVYLYGTSVACAEVAFLCDLCVSNQLGI